MKTIQLKTNQYNDLVKILKQRVATYNSYKDSMFLDLCKEHEVAQKLLDTIKEQVAKEDSNDLIYDHKEILKRYLWHVKNVTGTYHLTDVGDHPGRHTPLNAREWERLEQLIEELTTNPIKVSSR